MDLWVGLTNPGEDRCANETCLNFIAWDNDEREKVTEEEIFGRGIEFNNPTECIRIMIGVPMMDDLYCSSMFHFVCQREYQWTWQLASKKYQDTIVAFLLLYFSFRCFWKAIWTEKKSIFIIWILLDKKNQDLKTWVYKYPVIYFEELKQANINFNDWIEILFHFYQSAFLFY